MGATFNAGRDAGGRPIFRSSDHQRRNRALDLAVGAIVFTIFLPLILATAIMTLLCNRGAIFKKVSRVTQCGRAVAVLNYRLNRSPDKGPGDDPGNGGKLTNGYSRFLARSRLVALPEIINVLTGELSFFDPDSAPPSLFDA